MEAARPGQFDIGRRARRQAKLCALLLARGGACRSFHESSLALSLLFTLRLTLLRHIALALILSVSFALSVSYTYVRAFLLSFSPSLSLSHSLFPFALFFSHSRTQAFLHSLSLSLHLSWRTTTEPPVWLHSQGFLPREPLHNLGHNSRKFFPSRRFHPLAHQSTAINHPRVMHRVLQYIEPPSTNRSFPMRVGLRSRRSARDGPSSPIRTRSSGRGQLFSVLFFLTILRVFTSLVGYPARCRWRQ